MEQFEAIRRDHAREELSIRELARRHGVHRRAVRQALESAVPPPKRAPESRPAPKLGAYQAVMIDEKMLSSQMSPGPMRLAIVPPTTDPTTPRRSVIRTPMRWRPGRSSRASAPMMRPATRKPVSYTHLTLPTILLV